MKLQSWLVTGATGMIGQALVKALVDEGHAVRTLGRSARSVHGSTPFMWSPSRGEFPSGSFGGCGCGRPFGRGPLSANAGQDRTAGPSSKAGRWAPTCCVKRWCRQASQAHGFKPPRSASMATRRKFATNNPPKAEASSRMSRRRGACIATGSHRAVSLGPNVWGYPVARRGHVGQAAPDLQIWPWRSLGLRSTTHGLDSPRRRHPVHHMGRGYPGGLRRLQRRGAPAPTPTRNSPNRWPRP